MGTRTSTVLYVLAMVAVIVIVDVTLLRHHFLARLLVNVGLVVVFLVVYVTLLRRR